MKVIYFYTPASVDVERSERSSPARHTSLLSHRAHLGIRGVWKKIRY
jgi:hypothetical protein